MQKKSINTIKIKLILSVHPNEWKIDYMLKYNCNTINPKKY